MGGQSEVIAPMISTFINYLQRMSITFSQVNTPLPPKIAAIVRQVTNVVDLIMTYGEIPDIDVRALLVLLCIGVPFIVDLLITGLFTNVGALLFHIVDFVVFAAAVYFLVSGFVHKWDILTIIFSVVGALYIILRIILIFRDRKKNKTKATLVRDICGYYLNGIIPGAKSELCFKDLNHSIHLASDLIVIVPKKEPPLKLTLGIIVGIISLFLGLLIFGVFDKLFTIPYVTMYIHMVPFIGRLIIAVFLWFISFFCFLTFILRVTKCGRKGIVKIKHFLTHWGLKLMLLVLDWLYEPILSTLVPQLIPEVQGCGKGKYLYFDVVDSNFFYPFLDHPAKCMPCFANSSLTEQCKTKCGGLEELRLITTPHLTFVNDILLVAGPLIAYCIGVWVIGLPAIYAYIIKSNRRFILSVNVYGEDEASKWTALLNRMDSTGLFLFEDFCVKYPYWAIYLIFNKLTLIIIDTFTGNGEAIAMILVPVYYLISALITSIARPYGAKFNNFFEAALEYLSLVFSILPAGPILGFSIPQSSGLIIAIMIVVTPFIFALFVFLPYFRIVKGTQKDENDFTYLKNAENAENAEKEKAKAEKDEDGGKKEKNEAKDKDSVNTPLLADDNKNKDNDNDNDVQIVSDSSSTSSEDDKKRKNLRTDDIQYRNEVIYQHLEVIQRPMVQEQIYDPYRGMIYQPVITLEEGDYSDYTLEFTAGAYNDGEGDANVVPDENNDIGDEEDKLKLDDGDDDDDDDDDPEAILNPKMVPALMLYSIEDIKRMKRKKGVVPDDHPGLIPFQVKKKMTARRMQKMFEILDLVLDGKTIEQLMGIFKTEVLFGALCVGWYLGWLLGQYKAKADFICGPPDAPGTEITAYILELYNSTTPLLH